MPRPLSVSLYCESGTWRERASGEFGAFRPVMGNSGIETGTGERKSPTVVGLISRKQ